MAAKKKTTVQDTERTWGEIFKTAVTTASEDPDAFVENAKGVAVRLGMTAEEVYAKIQNDPDFVKREALNRGIKKAADAIRKKFGF
jgi:hypothetical protein